MTQICTKIVQVLRKRLPVTPFFPRTQGQEMSCFCPQSAMAKIHWQNYVCMGELFMPRGVHLVSRCTSWDAKAGGLARRVGRGDDKQSEINLAPCVGVTCQCTQKVVACHASRNCSGTNHLDLVVCL